MRRARITVWLGMMFFASNGSATDLTSESFLGVWEAQREFGKTVDEILTIERRDDGFTATYAGVEYEVGNNGGAVRISTPDGYFRGWFKTDSQTIHGHWVQSRSANINSPGAIPIVFTKSHRRWSARIKTQPDILRLYLRVYEHEDGSLAAIVRNPERNVGIWWGEFAVKVANNQVALTSSRGNTLLSGQFDAESNELVMPVPTADGGEFVFRRAVQTADSRYYAAGLLSSDGIQVPKENADGWQTESTTNSGLDNTKLNALVQSLREMETESLATPYIHSLLIAHKGKLVLEEYFYGHRQDEMHDTRSAGKVIGSLIVGASLDRASDLNVDLAIAPILGNRMSEPAGITSDIAYDERQTWRSQLTIGHALSMQSGLDADDNDSESVGSEDRMQEQSRQPNWREYIFDVPMVRAPGTQAVYGSNNINLAGTAVAVATGRWLPDLFYDHIAQPLGITEYRFNLDPAGNGYVGGGIRLRPRDQLKVGQMMLNGGTWNGIRVLSEEWVQNSTTPKGSIYEPNDYAYAWWCRALPYGERTTDVFYASGNGGQYIVCLPEFEMVVQISGGNYGNFPVWFKHLTQMIPEKILTAIVRTN